MATTAVDRRVFDPRRDAALGRYLLAPSGAMFEVVALRGTPLPGDETLRSTYALRLLNVRADEDGDAVWVELEKLKLMRVVEAG
jgi:hypothetical protein